MVKLWAPLLDRRGFLRRSLLFLGSGTLAACRRSNGQAQNLAAPTAGPSVVKSTQLSLTSNAALTPACGDSSVTPVQTPGPFYSPNSPQRQSLLEVDTPGRRLTLTGQVLTADCQPLPNCLVDFWQTDAEGNYDNQGYRLRGHQFTDDEGRYRLETIVPGIYPGRTRHLHVRVQPGNGPILTTQLYLPKEPGNLNDFLFQPELLMTVQRAETGEQAQFDFVVEVSRR